MRHGRVLLSFGLCAAALLGVMAWLTSTIRQLDRAQRQARDQAALEESIRLALWRMESLLGPLIAQQNASPRSSYSSWADDDAPTVMPPASQSSPFVRLYFQWDAQNRLTTPRLTARATGDSEESSQARQATRDLMRALDRRTSRAALLARLGTEWTQLEPARPAIERQASAEASGSSPIQTTQSPALKSSLQISESTADQDRPKSQEKVVVSSTAQSQEIDTHNDSARQAALNTQEFQARYNYALSNVGPMLEKRIASPKKRPVSRLVRSASPEVRVGMMEPVWMEDALILARRIRVGRDDLVQGCWLDWPRLQTWLLDSIRDLLPEARLRPVRDGENDPARRLAALPIRLDPGHMAVQLAAAPSTLRLPLSVAWVSAIVSLLAVGALLWGIASLDERRAAFVSAVTHELRTPLTTFRMYAEMLAEGMVEDEAQRRSYLTTLQREAERQSHLVENVLAYARLERGRYGAARETTTVSALLRETVDELRQHAQRCGMTLVESIQPECGAARVSVDASAVERILFNLVDNACKYARETQDRRIHLDGRIAKAVVRLTISDHGPGLSRREARRLFRPFYKSAREAANSAPGVGLGLALSRRLARVLGGDLRCVRSEQGGASFCLSLQAL